MEKFILNVPRAAAEKIGLSYDNKRRRWYCTREHPKFDPLIKKFLVETVDDPEEEEISNETDLDVSSCDDSKEITLDAVPEENATNNISENMKNFLNYCLEKKIIPAAPQEIWHNLSDKQLAYAERFGGVVNERDCAFKNVYSSQLYALWMKRNAIFTGMPIVDSNKLHSDDVIIDVGTTGTEADDDICEISILDVNGHEMFHSFFKPLALMTEGAAKVNLLTDTGLSLEPILIEKWGEITDILNNASAIYSYGADFDAKMILRSLEKNKNELRVNEFKAISTKIRDIKSMAAERYGNSISLKNAVKFLGIPEHELYSTSWSAYQALLVLRSLLDEPILPAGSVPLPKMYTIKVTGLENMQKSLDELFESGGRYVGHAQSGDDILIIAEK